MFCVLRFGSWIEASCSDRFENLLPLLPEKQLPPFPSARAGADMSPPICLDGSFFLPVFVPLVFDRLTRIVMPSVERVRKIP